MSYFISDSELAKHKKLKQYAKTRKSPGVILGSRKSDYKPEYPILGSFIGNFESGDTKAHIIDSEQEFERYFGKYENKDSIIAKDYLKSSPHLLVKRALGKNSYNAYEVKYYYDADIIEEHPNLTLFDKENLNNIFLETEFLKVLAKYPGRDGNNITVAMFTSEELKKNEQINKFYKAKDLTDNILYMHYFVAVFYNDKVQETFQFAINDLEKINDLSDHIYIKTKIHIRPPERYDGNESYFDGNDEFYYGSGDYYEGNLYYIDGNICLIDGNEVMPLFCVPVFYDRSILRLYGGYTEPPAFEDFREASEEFNNIYNYDIDLNIAENIALVRDDVVNFVCIPEDTDAEEFVKDYDNNYSIGPVSDLGNVMFIYGLKKNKKLVIPLTGEYTGLRSKTIVQEDIGVSNSKISHQILTKDLYKPLSFSEQEELYNFGINPIIKNYNRVFCNGEKLFRFQG